MMAGRYGGTGIVPGANASADPWGDYYKNFAANTGFTGNVGNTVAQAGQPATGDPYGLNALNSIKTGGAPAAGASPTVNRGGSSTPAGAVATAGNLTTPRNTTTTPAYGTPMNAGEDPMAYMLRIGMSPEAAQAALTKAQQNPGMSFQQIVGQGGASYTGALPPMNAGESSSAYMQRIGMSPTDIQAALTMAQQNPGMSFQQIIANGGFHIPGAGGGGSTGNNANPASQGVSLNNLTNTQGTVNGVPGYTGGGSFNIDTWKDPGYDFRLKEGSDLLQGSAAAQGNLLSGPTLKALTNYGQNAASNEYQNAYNRFTGNREFNYGVDVGDRNFDYLTQQGDRNFNYQMIKDLIDQGRYGTTGESDTNRLLATLISGNTIAAGNANAANTIGGGNALTGGVSQAIANMIQNQILGRLGLTGNG